MDSIPVIDFSQVLEQEPGSWTEVARQVKEACHGIGFLYLTNHGIPKEKIEDVLHQSARFFNLPECRKKDFFLRADNKFRGYTCAGRELLSPTSAFEYREGFAIVGLESPQEFPDEIPEFEAALFALAKECNLLTRRLLSLFGIALGLPDPELFVKSNLGLVDKEVPNRMTLRTHWYPPIPEDIQIPETATRCGEHTDYGVCTLLFQDSVGGLEVKNAEGKWVPATPIPGSIVVNLGDVMEIWTGGYFKATGHRVRIPEREIRERLTRQSIAYFVQTDDDYMIRPLKSSENYIDLGREFEPLHFGEYFDKRVRDTYQY